jgi:type I restriction enzyme S subunit
VKAEWQHKKLGDVAEVIAGQSPEGAFYNPSGQGLPFYQGKKDFSEKFIDKPTTWTTQITKIALEGDVLMSVRAPVGPVNFATEECCIGRGLAAIRSGGSLNRNFLFYFLLWKQDEISGTEGAVFASINKNDIQQIPIEVPALTEQKRIVGILDEAFDGIATAGANAEKNLRNSRGLFESHSEAVFTQQGKDWVKRTLGDVCDLIDCLHKTPTYVKNGFPMVRVTDIKPGFLDLSNTRRVDEQTFLEFSKKHTPKVGDIVFSRVGSYGVSSLVNSDEPFCLGQNTVFIIPKINSLLLYYFLNSSVAKAQFDELVAGTTQPTISLKSIREVKFMLPPPCDNEGIITKLEGISSETRRLESIYRRKLAALDELKKSLLHKAFTGEL